MPIAAHLLEPPLMVRDGVVYAPPKGKKYLGDTSAIDAARVLSVGVENPHLDDPSDQDGPALLDDLLGKVGRS
jgi:hypothetical protein